MASPGGSATINGVLFQLLGSLHRAARLHLDATLKNGTPETAILRIEPLGGGGDLQIHVSEKRIIEQWKARTGGGSWSLHEVIDEVLFDLYRAVNGDVFDAEEEYRFATEGRRGSWSEAEKFFADLNSQPPPLEPLAALDDDEEIEFFPKRSQTRRAFFLEIAETVRRGKRFQDEPQVLTHRKLWHLLGHFRIVEQLRPEQLSAGIDQVLTDIVERVEDVPATRERLCGLLMSLAGKGEVTLTPGQLLARAGLRARSFKAERLLRSILRSRLQAQITASLRYERKADVRLPPEIPENCRVLILVGESGQGKSWLLARLAQEEFAAGRLAVWAEALGDCERDLTTAANEIWQHGLDHDAELPLHRIAARRNSLLPKTDQPWVTVCIDDVQSSEETRRLINRDWCEWNIRLALTVPPAIGRALKDLNEQNRFCIVDVADFTIAELQSCLRQHGRNWAAIPTNIRDTLRRSLLCHLYCQNAATADRDWKPTTEYQLYERCWERVLNERSQPDHPHDGALLGKLAAGLVLKSEPIYPWSVETLLADGISEAAQRRLQAIGWLKVTASGGIEVWHDRLLNWAIAAGLVRLRRAGLLSTAELVEAIKPLWTEYGTRLQARLRYVPADLLWLLCGEAIESTLRADVDALLVAKEDGSEGGHGLESFYENLVPTLGERVIPFLIARLRVSRSERWNPYPRHIATALARIGRTAQVAVEACIPGMLQDSVPEIQEAAVLLSTVFPLARTMESLWKIHQQNFKTRDQQRAGTNTWRGSDYEESFEALQCGVNANPNWLVEKIPSADPAQEPVSELAYLTATLEGTDAPSIWEQVREDLFRKVPPDNRRSLANCVMRFRDRRAVEQLEEWIVADHEWVAPAAFTALAAIAPDRALAALSRVDAARILFYRQEWLHELFLQRPTEAQRALVEWAKVSPELLYQMLDLFACYEHQLDTLTVEYLLGALEKATDELHECATHERCPNYFRWGLHSIARIATPDGLALFAFHAGSLLETKLTDMALRWLANEPEAFAEEIADLENILQKIGGTGIQKLINAQLSHTSAHVRFTALRRAPIFADSETILYLERIADEDELADCRPRPMPTDQADALLWLASERRNAAVVRAVLRWGNDVVRERLADIRQDAGPMTDEELRPAIEALSGNDPVARRHVVCVLGLSGRRDYIQLVREFLDREPIGSDAAIDAMLGLTHLRDDSDEFAHILERHLIFSKGDHGRHAINALSAIGTAIADDILERAFISDVAGLHQYRWSVVARLCRDKNRRERLLPHIWEKMRITQDFWGSTVSECYELVAELPQAEVREFLWRKATPPQHSNYDSVGQRAAAISALAKIDAEAAFSAADSELTAKHSLQSIPEILLRIDSTRAIPRLCDQAVREIETAKRWQIARALRLAEKDKEVNAVLSRQMESGLSRERMSAAESCGWMGVGFLEDKLRRAALEDGNANVRTTARNSLRRQAREAIAQRLTERLVSSAPKVQWTLALAIVDLLDPHLLLGLKTPVPFSRLMARLPAAVLLRVNTKLAECIRQLEDEARKQDRKSESSFSARVELQ